ncbi:MAG: sulfate adenylyltransferase [Pseudomonadota bacterium]|nr:sulfate adenylyltransferase [Pseudomonadota bacterium]
MSEIVPPHGGGSLKPLLLAEEQRADMLKRAESLKKVPMTSRETSDVIMLAMGAYTPLKGFLGEKDWLSCCEEMKLSNDLFWPIPITLSTDRELAESILLGEEVALIDDDSGETMAVMIVEEKYSINKELECKTVYLTTDENHPGAAKVLQQKEVNLSGPVTALSEGEYPKKYPDLFLRPMQSRELFEKKNWRQVAAFQTRNPMHRSHEHLAKIAIEITDGVFIHQVLGKLKVGDIPAETRTKAIQAMIDNYFVSGTVIQAGYPIEMRYAGPREALFHALIRQNFGCSHLIVGRDHAGVGDYYGPFDAQHIFDDLWNGALITVPLKIDITFFCVKCDGMATAKTCPHDDVHHINISGTKQREMLSAGVEIPPEFSRPEVVKVLQEFYANRSS